MNKKLERTHSELYTPKLADGRLYFHPILMMHASHHFGKNYTEFMTDYKVLVESNMKSLEMYDHDAVSVISDPYRETSAFGFKVSFSGNDSPSAEHRILSLDDAKNLKNPNVYDCERTMDRIKGVKYFRQLLPRFPIIGWIEGPLAEAADLVGVSEILTNIVVEPDLVKILNDKCLQTAKDFALAQIEAGSNIIGVGDAVCSLISADLYEEFCMPLHQELFEFIHQHGAIVKLHICGNITHLLPFIAKEDVDILDLDWMVDMKEAYTAMGADVVLCGNIDPVAVIMNGDKTLIKDRFDALKNLIPRENWIVMGGCEIPEATPVENMKYLRELSLESY